MLNHSLQIRQYIESKQGAWADTTLRSESARLNAAVYALDLLPQDAHIKLAAKLKPYAVKTTMVRLADFRAFFGDHTWKAWIKSNARLYKNAYTRSVNGITHEEAKRRAALLTDISSKNIINELLDSGVRSEELRNRADDRVLGKGSKIRKVFGRTSLTMEQRKSLTYREIYNACRSINTTPHACRKAFATHLARSKKVSEVDMLKIMGWESFETAKSYLQPTRDAELAQTLEGVFNNGI